MEEVMKVISNFINNVGFPIAISVALFYQLMKTNQFVMDFKTTIDKNTAAIEKLVNEINDMHNRKEG